jgi:hypothetical protein
LPGAAVTPLAPSRPSAPASASTARPAPAPARPLTDPAPPQVEKSAPVQPPAAALTPAPPAPAPPPVRDITDIISTDDLRMGQDPARKPLFEDESRSHGDQQSRKRGQAGWKKPAAIAAAVVVLAAGGYFGWKQFAKPGAAATAMGTLDVQSSPPGAEVFVDGESRGITPARLSVKPGAHILELRGKGVPRVIPFTVAAGAQVSQYLEFADTPVTGQLQVQSQPAGAKVLVDGVDRGVAPVTVTNLTPGDHEVVLQAEGVSARQVVTVQAGGTASLVAPVGPDASAGPVSGWVKVQAPVSLEIREGGRLLGSSDADRVMMAAGRHELELVNELLGYRSTRVIQVPPGKVAPINIELPNGTVNLNASPWAEVWIDGQRVGETPIGNLSVPIGPHEVVFRNPQLGEKRHAISVTLGAPVRLSVDMK